MAYTAVPVDNTEAFSVSQPKITENFTLIRTSYAINHVDFNDPNNGKHKHVTLPEQAADPTTAADEVALYSKASALGGLDSALYLRKENDGDVIDFTSAGKEANGWTRLPSGILLKWGSGTTDAGAQAFALPVGATIPSYTTIYSVNLTPNGDGGSGLYDYIPYLLSFTASPDVINVYGSARTKNETRANINFRYLVIGI